MFPPRASAYFWASFRRSVSNMIAPTGNFSADVRLLLHTDSETYELGQLGPGFAILRTATSISATNAEVETIIDGAATRMKIRITVPPTEDRRRFEFSSPSKSDRPFDLSTLR